MTTLLIIPCEILKAGHDPVVDGGLSRTHFNQNHVSVLESIGGKCRKCVGKEAMSAAGAETAARQAAKAVRSDG